MSKRRTERLLSIVVLLLSTRRYLTAEEIRASVHGYPEQYDAFKRMFERDKEELRDLGIPLETGQNNALDEEPGYRISRQDYELPEIRLEPDEVAVLGIAARVWQSAELAGAAAGALLKLKAAGLEDDATQIPGIEPRLTTQEPAFWPLWEAVRDRRPVTFSHKAPGRANPVRRELEPWGVVNWRGRWYVAGHDRTRNATRVFRLSRIEGSVKMAGPAGSVTVPPGADVRELVKDWDAALVRDHTAVLRVRENAGFGLRRWAREITPDPGSPGWDRVTVSFADVPWYADYLASFGQDVMVVEPPDLREAVINRLKGVLASAGDSNQAGSDPQHKAAEGSRGVPGVVPPASTAEGSRAQGARGAAQAPHAGRSGGRPPGQQGRPPGRGSSPAGLSPQHKAAEGSRGVPGGRPPGQPRMVTSAERLRRLLALVPYVMSRKVVGLAETAATFGMTERELIDDLNLAWCVELMAPDPYCPIDLSYEGGEIVVSQAESIARPLRLAADEASALLVALRMLAEVPGGGSAVARLIAKIETAAGASAAASAQVTVQIDSPNGRRLAAQITAALAAGKRLHLRYYVPGRDEATERDVDPMRLIVVEGRTYLEAWCLRAEGVRLFRLDRVLDLSVLDVPASVPESAEPVDVDAGLFRPSESDEHVQLELTAAARWVATYYPCESVTELGEGRLRAVLRTPDTRWVRRLMLRLGEEARVVAPASLAAEIRAAAAAALALYE